MTTDQAFKTIGCACFGNPDELSEAFDTLKKAIESQQEPKWIPVKDRLPTLGEDVLICDCDGDVYVNFLHIDDKWGHDYSGNKLKNIIAWMPLPEPYEPQESGE